MAVGSTPARVRSSLIHVLHWELETHEDEDEYYFIRIEIQRICDSELH